MKTKRNSTTVKPKNIFHIAIAVGFILLIPLFANQYGKGWNWGLEDFIFAFIMLFGAGIALDFTTRKLANSKYKAAAIMAIVLSFLYIWAELAVGIFTSLGS